MFLKGSMWMLTVGVVLIAVGGAMRCDLGCSPKRKIATVVVPPDASTQVASIRPDMGDIEAAERDPLKAVPDRIAMLKMMARDTKDVVQINCLSDKELQVKALAKLAVPDASPDKLDVLRAKAMMLMQEAQACTGHATSMVGKTQVTVASKKEEPKLPVVLQWSGAIAAVLGGLGGLISAIAKLIEALAKWHRKDEDEDPKE